MGPVTSIKRARPTIWIPPSVMSIYAIEIETSEGTTDVTGYCEKASFKSTIQPGVGTFEVVLMNPNDKFTDKFSSEDKVKLKKDYGTTASTIRIAGIVENIDPSNHRIKLTGKLMAKELIDIHITGDYSEQEITDILKDIIDQVNAQISTNFTYDDYVNNTGETITISFNNKSAMECIEILCKIAGFDFYVDKDKKCHFFEEKSIENTTDAVVHNYNLLKIKGFSRDVDKVKNRIIVQGAVADGIPILYTTEDSTSISNYGTREEPITDTSLTTYEEAKKKGDVELAMKKDPPIVGEVESTLLVALNPGDMLRVSAPAAGIGPDTYKVVEFEDIIKNNDVPRTKIKLEKWKPSIPLEFRDLFLKQKETQDIVNINKLEHSYFFSFDDKTNIDDSNSSGYDTSEGYLVFTSASGYIQSTARDTGSNINKFEVRASGDNLIGNITYKVSVDNGLTWQTVDLNTLTTPNSEGHQLKIRVETSSTDAKIATLAILYST